MLTLRTWFSSVFCEQTPTIQLCARYQQNTYPILLFVRAKVKCKRVLPLDGTFAIPLVYLSTTLDGCLLGCLVTCGCSASRNKTKGHTRALISY